MLLPAAAVGRRAKSAELKLLKAVPQVADAVVSSSSSSSSLPFEPGESLPTSAGSGSGQQVALVAPSSADLQNKPIPKRKVTAEHDAVAASYNYPTTLTQSRFPQTCYLPHLSLVSADCALFQSPQEVCLVCGGGWGDEGWAVLFCCDCGECFHSFCVDAPIGSMGDATRHQWRCMNCSLCAVCNDTHAVSRHGAATTLLYCSMCDRGV